MEPSIILGIGGALGAITQSVGSYMSRRRAIESNEKLKTQQLNIQQLTAMNAHIMQLQEANIKMQTTVLDLQKMVEQKSIELDNLQEQIYTLNTALIKEKESKELLQKELKQLKGEIHVT